MAALAADLAPGLGLYNAVQLGKLATGVASGCKGTTPSYQRCFSTDLPSNHTGDKLRKLQKFERINVSVLLIELCLGSQKCLLLVV